MDHTESALNRIRTSILEGERKHALDMLEVARRVAEDVIDTAPDDENILALASAVNCLCAALHAILDPSAKPDGP